MQGCNQPNSPVETETGLTEGQQIVGMRYVYGAASVGSVLLILLSQSAVGALFIKQLGGTDFQAMLPASLMLLARAVQIPVSMKVAPGRGHRFMLRMWGIAAGLMLLAFALPTIVGGGDGIVELFLILLGLAVVTSSAGGAFWFPMLHDLVPVHRRGRFFGRLRATWTGIGFVVVLGSGFFLGKDPDIWRFQVVFGAAVVLYCMRTYFAARIPTGNSLSGELDYDNWRIYVRSLFRQKPLVVFLAYYGVLGFCMGFLSQPLVLYMKARGFPAKDNVIIFSFTTLGAIVANFFAGSLVDRFGTKRIFLVAHLILCLTCFAVVGIGWGPYEYAMFLLPAAMVVSGGTIAASNVACTAQLLHLIPNRGRAFYFSLATIITFAGVAISPLFVGFILDGVGEGWHMNIRMVKLDIFQVLLFCAGVMTLIAIAMLMLVRNVHPNKEEGNRTMEYVVQRRRGAPPARADWDGEYWKEIPALPVNQFHPNGSDHRPVVAAKLAHSSDALHVFFRVQDRYVRAVAEKLNDMVCRDSCVELFIQPPSREEYINFEINGGGTMLASFVEDPTRPDRHSPMKKCTPLTPDQASLVRIEASLPKIVDPEITEPTEWTVRYGIPMKLFEEFYGPLGTFDGQTWRANLYKCGDKTSHPHWASWSPVGEKLNFHKPACFGSLHFEE
ncbi:MAG: MFS transporter [Phycisphaerae bacterium]|nr:MFS transporter [Phycisphaerae bacterium]